MSVAETNQATNAVGVLFDVGWTYANGYQHMINKPGNIIATEARMTTVDNHCDQDDNKGSGKLKRICYSSPALIASTPPMSSKGAIPLRSRRDAKAFTAVDCCVVSQPGTTKLKGIASATRSISSAFLAPAPSQDSGGHVAFLKVSAPAPAITATAPIRTMER
ncbi:hypothetical protein SMACR_09581 [Sordaria macrospora]|uniref:WGS project CABT00000000 data, contig 2.103 n=2 Tax=Sordaria macrospora TaxID=5147 RepID=F7WC90_SORMK|nr:uncharacterized protein SMAC_09581 [Sordaria macrospora k-hell]KAA8629608.1 hypothetical protein SMACR_09581 [Sordaria macrospora]KAH7636023.1 hypothetical protein B0T09DRAFT_354385 [Sordaria sp. MPI-SDFR-AT-0083]WPJ64484.1 hypothetical protein SMAC4_09581 [Sordaria macrospora]CCC05568.1 unnamed protein product [Sordaria macrospora k-hell]